MITGQSEAFSRVLIDKALEFSGWDLLDPAQVVPQVALLNLFMTMTLTCRLNGRLYGSP
jgi:hypothetical protein